VIFRPGFHVVTLLVLARGGLFLELRWSKSLIGDDMEGQE
jgi:hypothetical protein